jgi:hypothetical protein
MVGRLNTIKEENMTVYLNEQPLFKAEDFETAYLFLIYMYSLPTEPWSINTITKEVNINGLKFTIK